MAASLVLVTSSVSRWLGLQLLLPHLSFAPHGSARNVAESILKQMARFLTRILLLPELTSRQWTVMGSLPSRRKQIPTQPSSQNSSALGPSSQQPGVNSSVAVAVCDFPSDHTEPMVKMGEQLHLLSEDGEWWKVVAVSTGKNCYVPSNHVVKISHRWLYEGISREKAEELLLQPFNHPGSFLIRESQMRKGCYSLSIRHIDLASWDCVKHYRINRLENGWLYISPSLTFSTLQDLVDYYSEIGSGLCCCLKEPCFIQGFTSSLPHHLSKPVTVKRPALNWQEINSSDLLIKDVPDDSPISQGLREAISSYLLLTEDLIPEDTFGKKGRRCEDT